VPSSKKPTSDTEALKQASAEQSRVQYVLSLYVTGTSRASARALVNIRKLCEEYLAGRYQLTVVDLTKYPALALADQIVAAPTLIKELPLPVRRFIGDMSRTDKILVGLDLVPEPPQGEAGK
jgi:circadian clock protein KaiB